MAVSDDVIDTLIAEAGGNIKGLHAVSAVIANRAAQSGLTPDQVVKQPHQFEGYSNPGRSSREAQKSPHIRALAEKAYNDIVSGAVPDPTNGGTQFRAASASGVLGKNVVNIGGNVFKLGNAPSSAVAAIDAVAPVPRSIPTSLSAYADTPAVALPPLPIPRPSNPEGIRSVEINPDGTLKQSLTDALAARFGNSTARTGADTSIYDTVSGYTPAFQSPAPLASFVSEDHPRSNAVRPRLSQVPQALTSRSVHTVQIDPFTGNPVGSNAPFVSADHPLSNAVAPASPKTIYYNSTAGNVALPKGVVPASVTRDLASIAGTQMNRSGSPDDRQAPALQIAPTPLPARPSALNAPYIPGPNGFTVANKDASQLGGGSPSLPFAYGEAAPTAPSVAAIQSVLKPTTTYSYKQMQESNPLYEKYIAAQGADDIGAGPGSFADLQNALAPSRYITRSVRVPTTTYTRVPLPRPRTAIPQPQSQPRPAGGLLGLLFPGGFGGGPSIVSAPVGGNPNITYGPVIAAGNFAEGSPNASFEKQNGMGSVTKSMAASTRWNTGY